MTTHININSIRNTKHACLLKSGMPAGGATHPTHCRTRHFFFTTTCLFLITSVLLLSSCTSSTRNEFKKELLLTLNSDHQFFTERLKADKIETEEELPQRNLAANNTSSNIILKNGQLLYENFYDVYDKSIALFNRKNHQIAFGKNNNMQTYYASWVNSVVGVIAHEEMMIAITYTFGGTLGLITLEEIEEKMEFKSIYPFYQTKKSRNTIIKNIRQGRIRLYKDKAFNIKVDYNTLVRISKERFARWHILTPDELKKIKGDYLYQDLTFSHLAENAVLVFLQSNFNRKTKLVLAEYSLEKKKILSTKFIEIGAGIYYSTTENGEVITTQYLPDSSKYIFNYYSINTGEKTKSLSFSTSKETYPRNLVYNGRQLHGFYHEGNSIAISTWKE